VGDFFLGFRVLGRPRPLRGAPEAHAAARLRRGYNHGRPMKPIRSLPLVVVLAALSACITPAPPSSPPAPTATLTPRLMTSPSPTNSPSPTPSLTSDDSFLARDPGTIRVMTYNVNWDSIFPDDDPQNDSYRSYNRVDAFGRLLRATDPDILCLQEINSRRRASDLADYVAKAMGVPDAETWQAVHVSDDVIASRFPLVEKGYELETGSVLPVLDQAAALVDLPDEENGLTDLYVICSHFKSGGGADDISLRQRQADVIMAQVRDFETPGGNLDLPTGTPFVILGDFNAYDTDPALHVQTLTQGDINNESRYGVDLKPDWDGTALEDAHPSQNAEGIAFYTWRDDAEPFDPGALDRVFFSDSVLQVENAFVLNTTTLADNVLADNGLLRQDVVLDPAAGNFDHLPVVVDFLARAPE
jgi:endonuclease/exonuclease/phosphatase family metal-dependent hydrolase